MPFSPLMERDKTKREESDGSARALSLSLTCERDTHDERERRDERGEDKSTAEHPSRVELEPIYPIGVSTCDRQPDAVRESLWKSPR